MFLKIPSKIFVDIIIILEFKKHQNGDFLTKYSILDLIWAFRVIPPHNSQELSRIQKLAFGALMTKIRQAKTFLSQIKV